jgi:hypothetical protein
MVFINEIRITLLIGYILAQIFSRKPFLRLKSREVFGYFIHFLAAYCIILRHK